MKMFTNENVPKKLSEKPLNNEQQQIKLCDEYKLKKIVGFTEKGKPLYDVDDKSYLF